jgi:molecular chaperone IbpA
MTQLDRVFDSLFRNTIGFDYLNDFMTRPNTNFPHYDVIKIDSNHYVMEAALAGYRPEEIEVKWQPGHLSITSAVRAVREGEGESEVLYRGIAKRDFRLTFALPEHVEVEKAEFDNGLLRLHLIRNVPEALQPRQIPVTLAGALDDQTETTKRRKIKAV